MMKKFLGLGIAVLVLLLTACNGSSTTRLNDEQQATWDLIELRIDGGYDSWVDLWEWSNGQGIPWGPRINGERPEQEILDLAREYGLVYIYIESEPGFGDEAFGNQDDIIVLSHFELYTYNEAVRELSLIDETDGSGLDNWLENGGLQRLEETFASVEIITGNIKTDLIIEKINPEDWEFVEWIFSNTGITSFGDSRIVIGRFYQEIIPAAEEVQEMLLEAITVRNTSEFIAEFGVASSPTVAQLSEWLDMPMTLLELAEIEGVTIRHENAGGEDLTGVDLVDGVTLGSSIFENWSFVYTISDNGSISLEFLFVYDAEIYIPAPPEPVTLRTGEWFGGTDVPVGRWVITGSGSGNFTIWRGNDLRTNEILGGGSFGVVSVTTDLAEGDQITISGLSSVTFTPVIERTLSNSLSAGHWVVGQDIEAGSFDASAPSGSGNFVIWRGSNLRTNEILGDSTWGVSSVRVNLANGDRISISGINRVNFD